ncbi:hypothetical protein [Mucilaginibacter sp.]|uniref:hypothetical protein n=1 Tax=Mucilaginibacter sp. TaxID=1882438 RepID=UPI003B00D351
MINCKTLLGHKGLDFSISCLKTFIENSENEIHLQIFEDGTLSNEDKLLLKTSLKGSSVIDKADIDKQVEEKLSNYPACLAYRNSTIYGIKLFDIMLYKDEDTFYIDSDIYFIKNFTLPKFANLPIFMSDTFNAYSFQPLEFIQIKFPIYPYINSGFFYFPKELYNLNYIEELLNKPVIKNAFKNALAKKLYWSEQTIWAFLSGKSKAICYFNNNQIMMAQQVMKYPIQDNITSETIAIHLVSSLRTNIYNVLERDFSQKSKSTNFNHIELEYNENHLSKLGFLIDRLQKKWRQMNPKKYSNHNSNVVRKKLS